MPQNGINVGGWKRKERKGKENRKAEFFSAENFEYNSIISCGFFLKYSTLAAKQFKAKLLETFLKITNFETVKIKLFCVI